MIHANWLRNRLPASRINGQIPIQRWLAETKVCCLDLLKFGTPVFAFIYRSETSAGNDFLSLSVYSHFLGSEINTRFIKVFISQTKISMTVRRSDFRKYKRQLLPGYEALLDFIARQLEEERNAEGDTSSTESHLINAFVSLSTLPRCLASNKKKFDPNVPRSFTEA